MSLLIAPDVNVSDPLKIYAQIASITSASIALVTVLGTRLFPWLRAKIRSRALQARIGDKLYPLANLERSLRYYLPPFCQDVDPAGGDEPRLVFGVQNKLFAVLDTVLSRETEYRYIILLADSGMGKTSALLNYFSRYMKQWRKPYQLALIPLGIPDADDRIAAVAEKSNTVLLLDALDEDTLAIVDHTERVRMLLQLTREFRKVVITCRTQFFSQDEEIPKRTGILKVGARAAGEGAEYLFHKVYLSPFTDEQVKKYIRRLYPFWRRKSRRAAFAMSSRIAHLSSRPMLLAHIDDLVRTRRSAETSFTLYEEMVQAWLIREEGFIKNIAHLREFSELLAVDIYLNRRARGAERVPERELASLATTWNVPLENWKLSGRSLLNRDADGNFKFAHRSIMEFLFVHQLLKGNHRCLATDWTEQMRRFLVEALERGVAPISSQARLANYDFAHYVTVNAKAVLQNEDQVVVSGLEVDVVQFPGEVAASIVGEEALLRCTQLLFPDENIFCFVDVDASLASLVTSNVTSPDRTPPWERHLSVFGRYRRVDVVKSSDDSTPLRLAERLTLLPQTLEEFERENQRGGRRPYGESDEIIVIHDGNTPMLCIVGASPGSINYGSIGSLLTLLKTISVR
jgi:hypothetical protein